MRLNLGVIFGGKSVEHEISIISAVEAMANIDTNKYRVIPIYIDKENNWYTGEHLKEILHYRDIELVKRYAKKVSLVKRGKSFILESQGFLKRNLFVIDLVLPIGHGAFVEDGSLQGYLSMLGIPYVGSSVLGAAIGQDKVIQKELLKQNNIPVCDYVWFYDYEFEKNRNEVLNRISTLKYPLYVKPATLGSSIGITVAKDEKELIKGIKDAVKLDRKILIEEQVNNVKEINISVLGDYEKQSVSEIEEINVTGEFYSFKEKYVEGYSKTKGKDKKRKSKPLISKEMIEDMKNYAVKTFKVLNASGVARIDFLIDDKNKKLFVNEINTIPGDLSSYLWMAKKMSEQELIENLIKLAIAEQKKRDEMIYAFPGNLLEQYDMLDGNKLKNNK
jgi:D-alanine-D-alanine ligase